VARDGNRPDGDMVARGDGVGLPDVGAILRRLRTRKGLSLQDVAIEADISMSFLSAVERGRSDISLGRLARLAAVFDHDVGSLLGYSARKRTPQFMVKRDRAEVDRGAGIAYYVTRIPGTNFEVITATLAPHADFRDAITHEGIDIVYVTTGAIILVYDGVDYAMEEGDCTVYSAAYPHKFRNDSDTWSQVVSIATENVY
jgi:transcriptional regulator with XRE-family HTH domain